MLMGAAVQTDSGDVRRRYLTYQPEAEMFAGFGDFAFYEVKLKGAHLVAAFGRIVDLKPDELLTDLTGAEALVAAEPEVVEHMNKDHAEACRLYATKLRGAPTATGAASAATRKVSTCNAGEWACAAVPATGDPAGMLRAVLKQMAEQARAA